MKIATKLTRIGLGSDPQTGAISTPIYQTAAFQHPALGESTGYDYTRTHNPTRKALEDGIARLEGGSRGFAYASGMAALTSLLLLFKPGDHLVVTEDLYGGTFRLLKQVFTGFGIEATYVDTSNNEAVAAAIKSNTVALLLESITNPMLKVADIKSLAKLTKEKGLLLIVDSTFLTPYFQRPLDLGADIVVHSGTKYLGGHNDLLAGLIVVKEQPLAEKVAFLQNSVGAVLGPFDSWLLVRGLKTLALRLEKQQQNALGLAQWLQKQPRVNKVYYPGLPGHQGHQICRGQASGYGAMVSFSVENPALVAEVLKKVQVFSFAESLGGVESLITFPAVQTHADIPHQERERLGISDCLIRISVGIEDLEDLIGDLNNALA